MEKEIIKLTIDAGNTDILIGYFQGNILLKSERKPTKTFSIKMMDSWLIDFNEEKVIDYIGLSCVVPKIFDDLSACCNKVAKTLIVKPSLFPKLAIKARNRDEIGADFLSIYYGALINYKAPLIIFDLGSATKTMVINESEDIEGVAIKPGLRQSLDAMIENIPHLPNVDLIEPQDLIGHNTIEAITTGVFYGELSNIEHYGKMLDKHYGFNSNKIITGGYSAYFVNQLPKYHYEPDLILYGINKIIDINKNVLL